MMNEKVAEIGCEDSYFITPNGLDAKDEAGISPHDSIRSGKDHALLHYDI